MTRSSIVIPLSPEQTFAALTDLSRYGEWLAFHDSWRSDVPTPESLRPGATVSSVLAVKSNTLPFRSRITDYSPPRRFCFSAKQKGLQVTIELSVALSADGDSEATFQLELGGLPAVGPIGKAAVNSLHGEVAESMARFAAMCGA